MTICRMFVPKFQKHDYAVLCSAEHGTNTVPTQPQRTVLRHLGRPVENTMERRIIFKRPHCFKNSIPTAFHIPLQTAKQKIGTGVQRKL